MGHGRRAGVDAERSQFDREPPQDAKAHRRGESPEGAPERRARESLQRLGVVRVALQRAAEHRVVQGERDAQHRRTRGQRPLDGDAESPALGRAGLKQGVRAARAERAASPAASSTPGPPWHTVSAALTVTTRSVSTRQRLTRRATFPAVPTSTRSSASTSCTSTLPRKCRARSGETSSSSPWRRGRGAEPGGHEQGLALGRDPARDECLDRRLEGCAPRIAEHAGKRERGRLDHHGRPSAAGRRLFERRACQRKAERIAHGRADVVDRGGRRRRAEDDGALRCVEVLHAGAREQRNAGQRNAIAYDRA